jgi:hypothetical protein
MQSVDQLLNNPKKDVRAALEAHPYLSAVLRSVRPEGVMSYK